MRIIFVRHGQNLANLTREFSYRLVDYPLTELGRTQALYTGRHLAPYAIDVLASSPLKRAVETADALLPTGNQSIHVMEGFREINSGVFETQPPTEENWNVYNEVMRCWLRGEADATMPGGEDFHVLRERLGSALAELVSLPGGTTRVVVTHGGTIFAATKLLALQVDVGSLWERGLANCSITEFELANDGPRLRGSLIRFGDISHIPGSREGW